MLYTRLGKTGMQVSRICLGTMSFGNQDKWMVEIDKARPIMKRALSGSAKVAREELERRPRLRLLICAQVDSAGGQERFDLGRDLERL